MLILTKKSEYGLMALIQLCRDAENSLSAREISTACQIPLPRLMNILKTLAQHGLVSSRRGARGGYKLAVPADRLTLWRILQVLEGSVRLVQCAGDNGEIVGPQKQCGLTDCCSIRSPLMKIQERLEGFLTHITLAQLAAPETTTMRIPLRASAKHRSRQS